MHQGKTVLGELSHYSDWGYKAHRAGKLLAELYRTGDSKDVLARTPRTVTGSLRSQISSVRMALSNIRSCADIAASDRSVPPPLGLTVRL